MKIAVIGSGGWGTALAMLLYENKHEITLCSYSAEESKHLSETLENPFLPGVKLPTEFTFTSEPSCVKGKDAVVLVPPSFAVRSTAEKIKPYIGNNTILVSATKGIEDDTGMRMSEIVMQVTGKEVVAISGPSHAEEVSRGIPTGIVAASCDQELADAVQSIFMNQRFRVYTSTDPIGVEIGAAMKNVIALCAGICDGLGYGDNTKALLMTRGLTEIARLGMKLGARAETFAGLAGIGDLIVTCTSMHSRNRRAGILIGQGVSVEDTMQNIGSVVEGYYAVKSAKELAERHQVSMPITQEAYRILYERSKPCEAVQALMKRSKKHETEDVGWTI